MIFQILLGIGLMILGYLIMPKQRTKTEVNEMEAPTSETGRPIGVLFGHMTMKSPNFLGWWDKSYATKKAKAKKK